MFIFKNVKTITVGGVIKYSNLNSKKEIKIESNKKAV